VALAGALPAAAQAGPLTLLGIDAADGGPGGHGPIASYVAVVNNVASNVTNGGAGILVVGGGKDPADDVTRFWNQIATDTGRPVTFVNGGPAIAGRSLSGFAIIAVVDAAAQTSSGGLTQAEHDALVGRQNDITTFINAGGGLIGFTQSGLMNPYGYIQGFGSFTFNLNQSYANITPTAAGPPVGITDALDICCWHDEYLTYPPFLGVLATNSASGRPAALGGGSVFIGQRPPPTAPLQLTPPVVVSPCVNDTTSPDLSVQGNPRLFAQGKPAKITVKATDPSGVVVEGVPAETTSAAKQAIPTKTAGLRRFLVTATDACGHANVITFNYKVVASPTVTASGIPGTGVAQGESVASGCTSSNFTARINVRAKNTSVRRVDVLLDGERIKRSNSKQFSVSVPAAGLEAGNHRLTVAATDQLGATRTTRVAFKRCRAASPFFTG